MPPVPASLEHGGGRLPLTAILGRQYIVYPQSGVQEFGARRVLQGLTSKSSLPDSNCCTLSDRKSNASF